MSGKANNRDSTHTKNNKQVNSVPNLVFQPFKANRIYITILGLLSTGLCIFLFVKVMQNAISFSSDQLNEISNFAVNINLVVGALGLAIFLLPIKSDQNQKETLLIRLAVTEEKLNLNPSKSSPIDKIVPSAFENNIRLYPVTVSPTVTLSIPTIPLFSKDG